MVIEKIEISDCIQWYATNAKLDQITGEALASYFLDLNSFRVENFSFLKTARAIYITRDRITLKDETFVKELYLF